MTTKTDTEQERADFEAWYQHHHGDRDVYALDESGEYVDKQVQGAFNVWQARAALQSQDREDAERYRRLRKGDIDDVAVVRGLGAMDYGASAVIATYSEEIDGDDLDSAIDHDRSIEGGNHANS